MWCPAFLITSLSLSLLAQSLAFDLSKRTILQNGQARITNFPNTAISKAEYALQSYPANASEISYKGRWDSHKISWWSAAGIKFGYTGKTVAVTFGSRTIPGTLVGYRISGQDWRFTNVTAGGTHLLAYPEIDPNATFPVDPATFELRVSNWGYGIQIDQVHVAAGERLIKLPDYGRSIEFIGDSLAAGMYTSYEGLSSFAYAAGAGLGNTEYSITAYPGICVADQNCWGNPRGQSHQWFYASDTSWRAAEVWGENPEPWDFSQQTAADLVVINIGTNDANKANSVKPEDYVDAYKKLIGGVHGVWPNAQVVIMSLWQGFYKTGNSYTQNTQLTKEVLDVYNFFNSREYLDRPIIWDGVTNKTTTLNTPSKPFVHYFNTTGILQHNDIAPQWHPTDMGAAKVAAHLIRYINIKFGWDLYATGPEVLHETTYWNDEPGY